MEREILHIIPLEEERIVTDLDVGAKVKRGRDWKWGSQDEGSIYGIVLSYGITNKWCKVEWRDKEDKKISTGAYRIGYSDKYDLYYF